jgi:hypothetical protein
MAVEPPPPAMPRPSPRETGTGRRAAVPARQGPVSALRDLVDLLVCGPPWKIGFRRGLTIHPALLMTARDTADGKEATFDFVLALR